MTAAKERVASETLEMCLRVVYKTMEEVSGQTPEQAAARANLRIAASRIRSNGADDFSLDRFENDSLATTPESDAVVEPAELPHSLPHPIIPVVRCDSDKAQAFILIAVKFAAPQRNDLYIGKDGLVHRAKGSNFSKNARKVPIVREAWI